MVNYKSYSLYKPLANESNINPNNLIQDLKEILHMRLSPGLLDGKYSITKTVQYIRGGYFKAYNVKFRTK